MNTITQAITGFIVGWFAGKLFMQIRKKGFKYLFRRYCGWFPLQPCVVCNKWYWGGLPFKGWQAAYQECCSKKCHDDLGDF